MTGTSTGDRVLLVTAEQAVKQAVEDAVGRDERDCAVVHADGVDQALDAVDDGIDCILADAALPDGGGLELLRAVRAERPALPFLLCVEPGRENVVSEAIEAGVTDFLRPQAAEAGRDRLVHRVRNALASRRRERTLEQSERRYRTLVENSPAPINLFDADGVTVWGNDAVLDLLGLDDLSELVGRSVFEFIRPEDRAVAEEELAQVIEEGEAVGPTDFRLVRADGETRHVRINTTAGWYEGERVGQAVVVDVTDRHRHEVMLTRLHERTRAMTRADSREAVVDIGVETLRDLLELDAAAFYAFEDGRLALTAAAGDSFARPDELRGSTGDGEEPLWDAFVDDERQFWTGDADSGNVPGDRYGSMLALPMRQHGLLVGGESDGRGLSGAERETARLVARNLDAALDRAASESALRERDRQLQRKNRALERLNHLNDVIRDINRALVRSSTPAEIEASVCDRLAAADPYAFAWVAEPVSDGERLEPAAWAGVADGFVDTVRTDDGLSSLRSLVTDAFETGDVRVVADVLDEGGDQRGEALRYGYRSVAAVPVGRDGRVESVLVVHAEDAGRFDEEEQMVLAELGETVGFALRNVRETEPVRDLGRTEVELRIETAHLFSNRFTAETGATLELVGAVRADTETVRLFVRLRDAPSDVRERLDAFETVSSVRPLSAEDGDGLYQLTVSVPPLLHTAQADDAVIRTLVAEGGTTTLTAAVRGDVRSFVDGLRQAYPETELLARRQDPDPVDTRETIADELEERLTDRQLDALRTAHYGGFFEWPREATSAELAETRDIASSTFQYHLRAAERKLLSAVLDEV